MLTEICLYLKNWFDHNQPKYFGKMRISHGQIVYPYEFGEFCKTNQYYRIVGSVFNDGVHKHGSEELTDEEWDGAIWLMAVPKDVEMLSIEIGLWQEKYGGVSSENMSPFQSESFGGYSYSKASGGNSASASSVPTWQGVYADRLRRYKKI